MCRACTTVPGSISRQILVVNLPKVAIFALRVGKGSSYKRLNKPRVVPRTASKPAEPT